MLHVPGSGLSYLGNVKMAMGFSALTEQPCNTMLEVSRGGWHGPHVPQSAHDFDSCRVMCHSSQRSPGCLLRDTFGASLSAAQLLKNVIVPTTASCSISVTIGSFTQCGDRVKSSAAVQGREDKIMRALRSYISDEFRDKRDAEVDTSDWPIRCATFGLSYSRP